MKIKIDGNVLQVNAPDKLSLIAAWVREKKEKERESEPI